MLTLNPLSTLPALAVTVLALGLAQLYSQLKPMPQSQGNGRNASIDGLRGFLALFVFLHHASIWYFELRTGAWQVPPSYFYTHLGQSSVALFFMITAFLFSTKLLDSRFKTASDGKPMLASSEFWQRLFISRIMRLTPLYLFALGLMLVIAVVISDFQLREPLHVLLKNLATWITFTILGQPDLNSVADTPRMIAGVNWTLPYEWFFYLALPLLAMLLGILPSWPYSLISLTAMAGLWFNIFPWEPNAIYGVAFFGGAIAAITARVSWVTRLLSSPWGSRISAVACLLCLNYVFRHFSTANSLSALACLIVVFTILSCGNSLFGLLHSRAAQTLGDVSYSIYLLHGLVMYITFKLILSVETASQLSVYGHWGVILICTLVLLTLSFATFHWIEEPAIRSAPKLSRWLESK